MTQLSLAAVLMVLTSLSGAHTISKPKVPDAIKAPAAEAIVLLAHASGVQIYACRGGARWRPELDAGRHPKRSCGMRRAQSSAVTTQARRGSTRTEVRSAAKRQHTSMHPMRVQFPGCS